MEEWVIISSGRIIKRFKISEGQCLTIGRGKDANVVVNNSAVSRKHSSLELKDGTYYLADLHSLNGTKVNGEHVIAPVTVRDMDLLEVGKFIIKMAGKIDAEEESRSASATAGQDRFNTTLYVSGIYNNTQYLDPKAAKKIHGLSLLIGKASPAKLIFRSGKSYKAGKKADCDLIIPGLLVGSTQFHIVQRKNDYFIVHHDGLHASTVINGRKVTEEQKLASMDIIQVGTTKLRFI